MAALNSETPVRATIHWDDVLGQFKVRISAEFDTPLGHFEPPPVHLTAADLAGAISLLLNFWGGGSLAPYPGANPMAPLGKKATVQAAVDAIAWSS